MQKEIKKDEYVLVLDFLAHGHYGMQRAEPVALVLGEQYFSLLQVIVRDDINLKLGQRVYIGEGKRKEVKYIRGRIGIEDLTVAAKEELADVIEKIITTQPARFLDFFNESKAVTTRLHQLELLPGVGKKHLWAILSERKNKPFKSFDDLKKRVSLLPSPEKMIVKRILEELEDKDRYRLFVPRIEKISREF